MDKTYDFVKVPAMKHEPGAVKCECTCGSQQEMRECVICYGSGYVVNMTVSDLRKLKKHARDVLDIIGA